MAGLMLLSLVANAVQLLHGQPYQVNKQKMIGCESKYCYFGRFSLLLISFYHHKMYRKVVTTESTAISCRKPMRPVLRRGAACYWEAVRCYSHLSLHIAMNM